MAVSGIRGATRAGAPDERSTFVSDTIHLGGESGQGMLQLVGGEVTFVSSKLGLPSLREHLVAAGLVAPHEIDLALSVSEADCPELLETILGFELASPAALTAAFAEYAKAHLRALLRQDDLRVTWTRASVEERPPITLPLERLLDDDDFERWGMLVVQTAGAKIDERIPVRSVASVDTPRGSVVMTAENVSRVGSMLRTPVALAVDTRIEVLLMLGGKKIELPARVVCTRRGSATVPQAVDVHWVDVPETTQLALARVIDSLRAKT